jgi:hypothetical protein
MSAHASGHCRFQVNHRNQHSISKGPPMKLSHLLRHRQSFLHQAHVANLAFACTRLTDLAGRVTRAGLRGAVRVRQPTADIETGWTPLVALAGSQSVIEEHFTDEDLIDLADALAFVTDESPLDLTFCIEELADRYVAPLRAQLTAAGVTLDEIAHENVAGQPSGDASR